MYRESERLMADPAVEQGDRTHRGGHGGPLRRAALRQQVGRACAPDRHEGAACCLAGLAHACARISNTGTVVIDGFVVVT